MKATCDYPRHILLLHQSAIGDFLLTLPVVGALRLGQPSVPQVTAIAGSSAADLALAGGVIQQRYSPENLQLHQLFAPVGEINSQLSAILESADLVLNFLGSSVERRIQQQSQAAVVTLNPQPTERTRRLKCHITTQWTKKINQAGYRLGPLPAATLTELRDETSQASQTIAIHPGSGGKAKCWPFGHFLALADDLTDHGTKIIWIVGPVEQETQPTMIRKLSQRHNRRGEGIILSARWSELARELGSCRLYVGNDAGVSHLSASLGLPTVVLFGPSESAIWRPLGEHVTCLSGSDRKNGAMPSYEQVRQILIS